MKIRGFWGLKYKFDLALRLYGLYGLWSKILGGGVEWVITAKTTLVPAMLTRPEKCYTATVPTSARSEKNALKYVVLQQYPPGRMVCLGPGLGLGGLLVGGWNTCTTLY